MPRIIEAGEGSEDRTGRNDEEVLEEAEEPSDLRMVGAAGSGRVASMTSCQPFSVLYTHVRHFNETYLIYWSYPDQMKWERVEEFMSH